MLKEIEKINSIVQELENIDKEIAGLSNPDEIKKLETKKQLLFIDIAECYLIKKLNVDGLTDELLKQFSSLAVERDLLSSSFKEKKDYNLSSEYVVSNITNESIPIKYMPLSEKIETIYYHTGEVISIDDPVISNKCNNAATSFIQFLEKNHKNKLEAKYGKNWKEEIIKIYQNNYKDSMSNYIDKIVENVDTKKNNEEMSKRDINPVNMDNNITNGSNVSKDNIKIKQLSEALTAAHKTIGALTLERDELINQVKSLSMQITTIKQQHKDELEQIKTGIAAASNQINQVEEEQQQPSIRR